MMISVEFVLSRNCGDQSGVCSDCVHANKMKLETARMQENAQDIGNTISQ